MTPTPPKRRCGGTNNNYLLQHSAALSGLRRMVDRSVTELSVQGSRLLGVQAEEASMCLGQRDDRNTLKLESTIGCVQPVRSRPVPNTLLSLVHCGRSLRAHRVTVNYHFIRQLSTTQMET